MINLNKMSSAKDILIIWVGQAGVNIAERFWKYAYETLQIPTPGTKKQELEDSPDSTTEFYSDFEMEEARRLFFYNLMDEKEKSNGGKPTKYIPRTIFLDVETQPSKGFYERNDHMFPKDAFITSNLGSRATFARADRLTDRLKPVLLDKITRMISMRAIQNLEGIILVHATGGGAGSGMLQGIFEVLKDNFNKVPLLTFSIFPSPQLSGNVIEAYNTVFAVNELLTHADATVVLDNDKIIDLVREKYEIASPSFADVNMIISRLIFSVVMQFAFPGAIIRMDFNKLFTNLVPYKYMKFLIAGISPFKFDEFSANKTEEMIQEITDDNNYLLGVDFGPGRYTSALYMFMGKVGPEVKSPLMRRKKNMNFMEWMPTGTALAITPREKMTLDGMPLIRQGIVLANNSAIRFVFQRILEQFNMMMAKKAFLFHFLQDSIESVDKLKKAASNVERMMKFHSIAERSPGKKVLPKTTP